MGCKECGKPKCNGQCGCKSPAVLQINNPPEYITFHKVSIPAAMGDSTTNPPAVGKYKNVLLYYEADHTSWLYSTDGIPTRLTNGITNYEDAINLPQINGHTLLGNQSSSDLGLQGELTAGANIQINSNVISATDTTYTAGNGIELDGTEIKAKIGDGLEFDSNGEINIANIEQYAHFFDTVADMKASTSLIDGSFACTLGYHTKNDGGGALYLIREAEENETANGITTFAVDTLIAELVTYGEYVNMKQLGMSASIADNAGILQYAVTNYPKSTVLFIPEDGDYAFSTSIDLGNKPITIKGTSAPDYNKASNTALVFASSDGFTNARNVTFRDLCIKGNTGTPANKGITGSANLENVVICYFSTGVDCNYKGVSIIHNCNFHNNSGNAIMNPVDSRITNCTINANGFSGINLQQGANDNIITDNKIEWNGGYGITAYNADHLVISDNIIDRNGKSGVYIGGSLSRYSVITNNVLRRNGATSSSYDASNIQINEAYTGNVITGNVTQTGNSQDDGSGTVVPNYAIYIRDTTTNKVYLTDNVLTGGTNANPIGKNNASNVVIIDQNHPIYDNLVIKKQQVSLASNSTATFVVDFDSLPEAYSVGKSRKIVVNYRATSDAAYGSKIINVYAYKQYNVYHLDLDNTTITGTVTASGSYSAEDGFVITFTSTSTADFQLLCTEYTC